MVEQFEQIIDNLEEDKKPEEVEKKETPEAPKEEKQRPDSVRFRLFWILLSIAIILTICIVLQIVFMCI